MSHRVVLTDEAEYDLLDIYGHQAATTSPMQADELLDRLEQTCEKLGLLPGRGHVPPELERVGITLYREIHHRPYRILYELVGDEVCIHAILDGRRNMQALLERRLLR